MADGLAYLHGNGIVHGDLRASNVLVDDSLAGQICDFGLAEHYHSLNFGTVDLMRNLRHQSPELLCATVRPGTSKEADIYAFAMTAYEVCISAAHDSPILTPGSS